MAIDFNAFKIPGIDNEGAKISKPDHDSALEQADEVNSLDANATRAAKTIKTIPYHKMIRMISDKNIENLLPWHFEQGGAYHCLSYGGIDAWSYLKFILRQQRLKYCLISSWIISPADADEIHERVKAGDIGKVDFYVGDIFKGGYRGAYDKTLETAELCGGRVAIFHNHAKVIAGFGEQFDFAIEMSTNLNINLRLEQTTIFIDHDLAVWYKNYFDEIHAFNRDFDGWKPYEVE